jgi:hypothetical protein
MSDLDPLQPFSQRQALPPSLRPPVLIVVAVFLGIAGGAALGFSAGPLAHRLLRAIFFSSAFAYLVVSLFDFWEHFRLEKLATGKWWSMSVLPLGETLNHLGTGFVIVAFFVLARPLPRSIEPRDWFVLAAPAIFWTLGWRDELVYHRRRCVHREDIIHTVAHLCAGVMMCSFLSSILCNFN